MKNKMIVMLLSLICPVLVDAQMLVVAASNSELASLSESSVRQLYMGNTRSAGGFAVLLLDMPEGSTSRKSFYRRVADKSESQLKSYWARMIFTGRGTPPRQVGSAQEMVSTLKANPGMLGYLEERDLQPGLKVLLRLP